MINLTLSSEKLWKRKAVRCGSGSPKVTLDQEGDDTMIFGILEKVHERPTFHIGVGDNGPLLPGDFAT